MTSVFIISAPSGSGKSTLVGHLMQRVSNLRFSVSYTTRKPRGQEKDGTEYYFISREQFEARIARDEFLEWADVFGNYYGTHQSELDRASADNLAQLLLELNREENVTLILVTHAPDLARKMDRTIELRDGRLQGPARRR